jgi:hypothetical protein
MKRLTLVLAALAFALSSNPSHAAGPVALSFGVEQGSPISNVAPASAPGVASQETPQKITAYTLAPDRYQKARELSRIYFRFAIIGFLYGLVVFWLILRWKLAPKYRDWAERSSSRRPLQAMVFSPLLILTVGVLELPTAIYQNWVSRTYGISVQGWGSWSLDWGKGELVAVIVGTIFIMSSTQSFGGARVAGGFTSGSFRFRSHCSCFSYSRWLLILSSTSLCRW